MVTAGGLIMPYLRRPGATQFSEIRNILRS
jgi:hypothetical protein